MNTRSIGTIYAKELRDLLRDRRTLISTIVIPTFVMPLIIIGFGKVTAMVITKAREEIPRVMMVGGADSLREGARGRLGAGGDPVHLPGGDQVEHRGGPA